MILQERSILYHSQTYKQYLIFLLILINILTIDTRCYINFTF